MPPNLTELAKQGDPKAIASLMNRSLQPKGITANASSRHDCLQLQLESTQVPNQAALVKFVQKGLTALGVESIRSVRVYGYQKGIETPAWEEEIDLPTPDLSHDALLDAIPSEESLELEMPDVEDVEPPPQPRKLNSRALILGSIALLLGLAALAYAFLRPKETPLTDTVTVPATVTPVSSPAASVSPTASASPTAPIAATPFRDAVNKAMQASTATQTAATPEQWQEVSQQWQASIDLMAKVPEGDANYSIAQQKIGEYQRNLDYAKQKAANS